MRAVFPDIDSVPHMDTLARLLKELPAEKIEVVIPLLAEFCENKAGDDNPETKQDYIGRTPGVILAISPSML